MTLWSHLSKGAKNLKRSRKAGIVAEWKEMRNEEGKEKGERRKEKGERRKEKGERRKERLGSESL
jgi:hypothetical protein